MKPFGNGFCPFCYGAEQKTPPEVLAFRPTGGANQPGWSLRVVPNKFPVLEIEGELDRQGEGMFDRMNGIGAHEVIVETPDHRASLADLPEKQVEDLLWAFKNRVLDLRQDRRLRYTVLFKNHGEAAGAALEHTHSQLIALPVIPKRVREEIDGAKSYFDYKERCIFCDIVQQELRTGARLVTETDFFVVLCPYAARFLSKPGFCRSATTRILKTATRRRCRIWPGSCGGRCANSIRRWSIRRITSSFIPLRCRRG